MASEGYIIVVTTSVRKGLDLDSVGISLNILKYRR